MSKLRETTGYSISAASLIAAVLISVDRYAEFAAGAENLASWAIPPVFLFTLAVSLFVGTRLGHPATGEADA